MAGWTARFDGVLRRHCRLAAADHEIDPQRPLAALGINSLDIVELILDLEEMLGLQFPQDRLTPEAFASPQSVWELCTSVAPALIES